MSDGASNPAPKKRHYAEALKDEIQNQQDEIADLKAQLAEATRTAPAQERRPSVRTGYDIEADPLGFIDENVDEVYLVSKMYALPGWTQRRHRGLEIGKDIADFQKAVGQRKWVKNPFHFTGTFAQIRDMRTMSARHWYFCIERPSAEYIFSFEKNPLPKKAVIAVEDYNGVNPVTGLPVGNKTPCSDDPLREYVRFVLQTNPGALWIDKAYFMDDDRLDEKAPNPYSLRYEVVGLAATADGSPTKITDALGDVVID